MNVSVLYPTIKRILKVLKKTTGTVVITTDFWIPSWETALALLIGSRPQRGSSGMEFKLRL